ncbi:hypothetical protein SLE2022_297830 [Rubroshorea leprosula]
MSCNIDLKRKSPSSSRAPQGLLFVPISSANPVSQNYHPRFRDIIYPEFRRLARCSKQIKKIRDEEFQPQFSELIQGLNRMWKAMFECHYYLISIPFK